MREQTEKKQKQGRKRDRKGELRLSREKTRGARLGEKDRRGGSREGGKIEKQHTEETKPTEKQGVSGYSKEKEGPLERNQGKERREEISKRKR